MSGLGEATAILEVIKISENVVNSLVVYCKNVRSAEEDIVGLGQDIASTTGMLVELQEIVQENHLTNRLSQGAESNARKCIAACQAVLELLRKLSFKAQGLETPSDMDEMPPDPSDVSRMQRVIWPWYKPKLEACRRKLRDIKLDVIVVQSSCKPTGVLPTFQHPPSQKHSVVVRKMQPNATEQAKKSDGATLRVAQNALESNEHADDGGVEIDSTLIEQLVAERLQGQEAARRRHEEELNQLKRELQEKAKRDKQNDDDIRARIYCEIEQEQARKAEENAKVRQIREEAVQEWNNLQKEEATKMAELEQVLQNYHLPQAGIDVLIPKLRPKLGMSQDLPNTDVPPDTVPMTFVKSNDLARMRSKAGSILSLTKKKTLPNSVEHSFGGSSTLQGSRDPGSDFGLPQSNKIVLPTPARTVCAFTDGHRITQFNTSRHRAYPDLEGLHRLIEPQVSISEAFAMLQERFQNSIRDYIDHGAWRLYPGDHFDLQHIRPLYDERRTGFLGKTRNKVCTGAFFVFTVVSDGAAALPAKARTNNAEASTSRVSPFDFLEHVEDTKDTDQVGKPAHFSQNGSEAQRVQEQASQRSKIQPQSDVSSDDDNISEPQDLNPTENKTSSKDRKKPNNEKKVSTVEPNIKQKPTGPRQLVPWKSVPHKTYPGPGMRTASTSYDTAPGYRPAYPHLYYYHNGVNSYDPYLESSMIPTAPPRPPSQRPHDYYYQYHPYPPAPPPPPPPPPSMGFNPVPSDPTHPPAKSDPAATNTLQVFAPDRLAAPATNVTGEDPDIAHDEMRVSFRTPPLPPTTNVSGQIAPKERYKSDLSEQRVIAGPSENSKAVEDPADLRTYLIKPGKKSSNVKEPKQSESNERSQSHSPDHRVTTGPPEDSIWGFAVPKKSKKRKGKSRKHARQAELLQSEANTKDQEKHSPSRVKSSSYDDATKSLEDKISRREAYIQKDLNKTRLHTIDSPSVWDMALPASPEVEASKPEDAQYRPVAEHVDSPNDEDQRSTTTRERIGTPNDEDPEVIVVAEDTDEAREDDDASGSWRPAQVDDIIDEADLEEASGSRLAAIWEVRHGDDRGRNFRAWRRGVNSRTDSPIAWLLRTDSETTSVRESMKIVCDRNYEGLREEEEGKGEGVGADRAWRRGVDSRTGSEIWTRSRKNSETDGVREFMKIVPDWIDEYETEEEEGEEKEEEEEEGEGKEEEEEKEEEEGVGAEGDAVSEEGAGVDGGDSDGDSFVSARDGDYYD